MIPLFDGSYKKKPVVSLGGINKTVQTGPLLEHVRQERHQRESHRRQLNAATRIQAVYRSYRVRKSIHASLRHTFQEEVRLLGSCSIEHLHHITFKLLAFYSFPLDVDYLIMVCQKWLSRRQEITSSSTFSSQLYQLKRILEHCIYLLPRTGEKSFAIPLRMFEVYLQQDMFISAFEDPTAAVRNILQLLLHKGYFMSLRSVLEMQVPDPDEPTLTPPTPLAKALINLLLYPLQIDRSFGGSFLEELIIPPSPSNHIAFLVKPILKHSMKPATFLELFSFEYQPCLATIEVLDFMLAMMDDSLSILSDAEVSTYLRIVTILLEEIAPKVKHHNLTLDDEDDDIDDLYTLSHKMSPYMRNKQYPQYGPCITAINDTRIAKRLRVAKYSEVLISNICGLCYQLLYSHGVVPHLSRLFQLLSMNHNLVAMIWQNVIGLKSRVISGEIQSIFLQVNNGCSLSGDMAKQFIPKLASFCSLFTLSLLSIHDSEFYQEDYGALKTLIFSQTQLTEMVELLRNLAVSLPRQLYQTRSSLMLASSRYQRTPGAHLEWSFLLHHVYKLLRSLHERNTRRAFCPEDHWVSPTLKFNITTLPEKLFWETEEDEKSLPMAGSDMMYVDILKNVPFVFNFYDRVKLIRKVIFHMVAHSQPLRGFHMGSSINLKIHREHIYEDAFTQLAVDQDLHQMIHVTFTNLEGLDEAGIDGGGLFREFLDQLIHVGFDPNRGFFKGNHEGLLYPNPEVQLVEPHFKLHYRFLGRMLAKAIYENLLVELPLAGFFLRKLISRAGRVDVHHLSSLDPELYRNLLFLKQFNGDFKNLALNFTIVNNDLGQSEVVELKPGGQNISVTAENREEYIHLVADYRVNRQMSVHCTEFINGVASVIPLQLFQMLNEKEIQVLISGASVPIDTEDLKNNTNYGGSYTLSHPTIQYFWEVVAQFSEEDKKRLLKFVTSCSRPPLLGFKELSPKFGVQSGGPDEDRLPTASTCMNLLKLPEYSTAAQLKKQLLYAISSNAGFELS